MPLPVSERVRARSLVAPFNTMTSPWLSYTNATRDELPKRTHCDIIIVMKAIQWNTDKSLALKESRGVCFEDVVFHIEKGDILDDYEYPNQQHVRQRFVVIGIDQYAYLVPYVETNDEVFLKTIITSRKATSKYLGEYYEKKTHKRRERDR
jgi:uncharacterized DUF497 family protein